MKKAFALIAVAGLATVANAQNTRLIHEVSLNGTDWSTSVAPASGQSVWLRVRAAFEGTYPATATAQGLAGLTYQPTVSNWRVANTRDAFTNEATGAGVDGSVATNTGRINPFASTGQGSGAASGLLGSFVDGGNTLRFAGSKNTTATTNLAWGVISGQVPQSLANPPSSYNNSITGVEIFRAKITVNDLSGSNMTFTTPLANINQARGTWYTQASGLGSLAAPVTADFISGATIVVPTPGALALLGLGGLVAGRRRR